MPTDDTRFYDAEDIDTHEDTRGPVDVFGRDSEDFDAVVDGCLACGGELTLLGSLGRLTWFRCRACGLDQSTEDR